MTAGRLVLDGGDPEAVGGLRIRVALARSAERALLAGRGVDALGPVDELHLRPAACTCHATAVHVEGPNERARWLLARTDDPSAPTVELLPTALAARTAAAVATGFPLPADVEFGTRPGLRWQVWTLDGGGSPLAVLLHPRDVIAAAQCLPVAGHVDLRVAGSAIRGVSVVVDEPGRWVIESARPRGYVVRELRADSVADLGAHVGAAVEWLAHRG